MNLKNIFILNLIIVLILVAPVFAEDYKIGPEDILEISFYGNTELNKEVRVNQNGTITLDIIGEIEASGKTTKELQDDIVKEISRFKRNITQAIVRVTTFNSQYIFVTGQVNTPGKHTFENIPDLWTIINEAGGISELGDLSRVLIIRGGEDAGKMETINVAEAMSSGKRKDLPEIEREDTIEIPRTMAGLIPGDVSTQIERKNLIYAVGAVNSPGAITFEKNVDILEAIALAGGPTAEANLKEVKVITKDGFYAQTYHLNLEKYYESGIPARYTIRKEDAIIIPRRGSSSFLGINWVTLGTVAGVITSSLLVYDQLRSDEPR
ncbi:MAG: polysaccharide biosynthesis/export family protein [candidate division Zixibacteria bacterium]|nr:polysaccharide biosynthesis/export family protein [candidate division Zixibacteria bacterium]